MQSVAWRFAVRLIFVNKNRSIGGWPGKAFADIPRIAPSSACAKPLSFLQYQIAYIIHINLRKLLDRYSIDRILRRKCRVQKVRAKYCIYFIIMI